MAEKKFFVGIKGVITKGGKVLLIKASQEVEGREHWEVPGGRIDQNESIQEALARELSEEVPSIKNVEQHEILYAHRVQHDVKEDTSLVLIFYRVSAEFENEEILLSEEHVDYKWVTAEEAVELAHPTVAAAIKAVFA